MVHWITSEAFAGAYIFVMKLNNVMSNKSVLGIVQLCVHVLCTYAGLYFIYSFGYNATSQLNIASKLLKSSTCKTTPSLVLGKLADRRLSPLTFLTDEL